MKKININVVTLVIIILYLMTHLFALTNLPVFADEAIYIRWSQLIIDDWQQYLFFPLNDGKTPLHMWLMIPFLKLFFNPLFAGRLLSVVVGLLQIFVIKEIITQLNGKKLAQIFGMLVVVLLPFWVFYHRLAIIDALLTFFLSTTVLGLITLNKYLTQKKVQTKKAFGIAILTGISYGCAILTKLPAIFLLPAFPLFSQLFIRKWKVFDTQTWRRLFFIGFAAFVGLAMFGLLKLQPAFGQLFSRGQDFTFTTAELLNGEWRTSFNNLWRMFYWHGTYLSFTLTGVLLFAPFFSKQRKLHLILLACLFIFIVPFVLYGRVLAPRYVLPMVIFSTVSISLFFEEIFDRFTASRWVLSFLLIPAIFISLRSFIPSWSNINYLPLVPVDREHYIEEWSAGQGIAEMVEIIEEQSRQGRVVVATEGYFGTLPDGLLMYFHNRNVDNIEIFGIGQPIRELPNEWLEKGYQAETAYLLVNTHRMLVEDDDRIEKIYSFPRPNDSSSLDVWMLKK